LLAAGGLILFVSVGTGCALHLHNAANEALARNADTAFKAADVAKAVAAERSLVQATHERDLEVTRRNVLAERDLTILVGLDPERTAGDILGIIGGRLREIGVPANIAARKAIYALSKDRADAMIARDAYLNALEAARVRLAEPPSFPPTPEDQKAALATHDGGVISTFTNYELTSQQYTSDLAQLDAIDAGRLGDLNRRIAETDALRKSTKAELGVAIAKLQKAIKAYKDEEASGTKSWEELADARKKIEDALNKFDAIEGKLEPLAAKLGMQDLLAEVRLAKIEEQRKSIGAFLDAFSKSENVAASGEAADSAAADQAGRVASVLLDATRAIQESSSRAKLVPLTFERERLRLEAERAQRMLDRGAARSALLEQQRAAFVAEAMKLVDAENSLKRASTSKIWDLILNDDQNALHALFIWAESISVDKLREEEIEVSLITLDHDEALDASEYALALWNHMIASPLEQLVAYHASGITPEDIANLVQAASLAGVAVGTNR
jgi:hypothetical protein